MAKTKWIKSAKFAGVRWHEHPMRKHGVRKDRSFSIRYQVGGKRYEHVLGWESSGITELAAMQERESLIEAYRRGDGPISLPEKRSIAEQERRTHEAEARRTAREEISFGHYFTATYLPEAQVTKKPETVRKEREHVTNWIQPVVGDIPMKEIGLSELKKIKANMSRSKRSPRTMQYVFRTFTSVWNSAQDEQIVHVGCPTKNKSFKLPKVNNARERFLNDNEAEKLLEALKRRSPLTHDVAYVGLYTGMRFNEIAGLTWGCVNTVEGSIRILNAKGDTNRTIYMPDGVLELMENKTRFRDNDLVFPSTQGQVMKQVPSAFVRTVKDLGLNDEVGDSKRRFSFHGLRHTCASWLIRAGASLYDVQKQLGHSTPVVTQRYAHLTDENLATNAKRLNKLTQKKQTGGKVVELKRTQAS